MIKKSKLALVLSLTGLILTSCNTTSNSSSSGDNWSDNITSTAKIKIYKDNNYSSNGRFIPSSKVSLKYTYNDLSGTLSNNENVMPSIGDANLLVIPVHLPGGDEYKTDKVKQDIQKAFFGEENDPSIGFKSVKQYYKEASYGKFNLNGVVTDWFDATSLCPSEKDVTQGQGGTVMNKILTEAVKWASTSQGINLQDYDQNMDGSIDGVYLVYDHLDWTCQLAIGQAKDPSYTGSDINQAFWNYTYWDWSTDPIKYKDPSNPASNEIPTTSGFSWSSFDMMYTSYCDRDKSDAPILTDLSNIKLDTHTFVHEFGHLLGLDDYYSSSDSYYHPAGQLNMMDQNVGDLDSYSKMLLGWITPNVVYGTSEISIANVSLNSDHSVIVIPSSYEAISEQVEKANDNNTIDKFTYQFNPFSEYIMIDLYTPDGNNTLDAYGPNYVYDRNPLPNKVGVRIYHIDSRIFKCTVVNNPLTGAQTLHYDSSNYEWDGNMLEDNQAILMPISNNQSESSSFQLPASFDYFDQIRLIEATGINTFDSNGYMINQTLFNEQSDPFDILTFGYQFFHANYSFNTGNDLPFKVKVEEIKESI